MTIRFDATPGHGPTKLAARRKMADSKDELAVTDSLRRRTGFAASLGSVTLFSCLSVAMLSHENFIGGYRIRTKSPCTDYLLMALFWGRHRWPRMSRSTQLAAPDPNFVEMPVWRRIDDQRTR